MTMRNPEGEGTDYRMLPSHSTVAIRRATLNEGR
jgi:hypothetical protein